MKIIYRRSAGLDVHEKSVFVCARILRGKQLEVIEATFPTFTTFTEDLEALRDWLIRHRIQRVAMFSVSPCSACRHVQRVAMESTGVYWRPVWNVLEQGGKLDLILLNPRHVKALSGHKTDRVDAARIAELAQYDLVRASFVPSAEIRELRDLVRRRVHLTEDRNRVSNRIHRLLELQNVKLSGVLGKMTGTTARSILEGLATARSILEGLATARSILEGLATAATIKPEALALLATHKRVRGKREQLAKALRCAAGNAH